MLGPRGPLLFLASPSEADVGSTSVSSHDPELKDQPEARVRIKINGREHPAEKGTLLLSAIQHLLRHEVPVLGRFCWNNECGNCELSAQGKDDLFPQRVRACQTPVDEDLELSELTPDLSYWLSRLR